MNAQMIRVDDDVYDALNEMGRTSDSFNDVLRRLLHLPARDKQRRRPDPSVRPDDAKLVGLFDVVDKHLPTHWASSDSRAKQILFVVAAFLGASRNWSIAERHLHAVKKVAEQFQVTIQTINDKCGRQLFGTGAGLRQQESFRDALKSIESDFRKRETEVAS